jgi:phage gpG-like protein
MKITKKPNFGKYKKAVDNLKQGLGTATNETITEIQKRTQSGKDYKGSSFTKYSDDYKEYKSKHYGSSRVNLTQTGNMLHSITSKKIKNGIRLYFGSSSENKKAYHNQVTNRRKFFGLSTKQKDRLLEIVKNYYKKQTK